jgi:hypothetical protein
MAALQAPCLLGTLPREQHDDSGRACNSCAAASCRALYADEAWLATGAAVLSVQTVSGLHASGCIDRMCLTFAGRVSVSGWMGGRDVTSE